MWTDSLIVCASAAVYAAIEIEMEGKHGWAANLPTAKKVLGDFTLYHLYMMLFVAITIGAIFIPRMACSATPWQASIRFLFYLLLWFLVEDFLWFVLNPYFTLKRYSKDNISWHKRWIGKRVPIHNALGVIGLVALTAIEGTWSLVIGLLLSVGFTVCVVFGAPAYHKFYEVLHKREAICQ